MAKIVCKLCNKEFSNLGVHLNKAHSITRADYDLQFSDEIVVEETILGDGDIQEETLDIEDKIDAAEIQKNIFDGEIKRDPGRPLTDFLDEFEIDEKELRAIVRQFKGGPTIPINQSIKTSRKRGSKQALSLYRQYKQEELTQLVETDPWIAEALVKEQGFTCIEVVKKPTKKWILKIV